MRRILNRWAIRLEAHWKRSITTSPVVLKERKALTPVRAQVRLEFYGCLVLAVINFVARPDTIKLHSQTVPLSVWDQRSSLPQDC